MKKDVTGEPIRLVADDVPDRIEMCLTCPARRMKGVEKKSRRGKTIIEDVISFLTGVVIGLVFTCILGAVIYAFSCLGNIQ